jgi:hypothetical protein
MERNNAVRDIKAKTPANNVSRRELANPRTLLKVLIALDSILLCVEIFHYCYALDIESVLPKECLYLSQADFLVKGSPTAS